MVIKWYLFLFCFYLFYVNLESQNEAYYVAKNFSGAVRPLYLHVDFGGKVVRKKISFVRNKLLLFSNNGV